MIELSGFPDIIVDCKIDLCAMPQDVMKIRGEIIDTERNCVCGENIEINDEYHVNQPHAGQLPTRMN